MMKKCKYFFKQNIFSRTQGNCLYKRELSPLGIPLRFDIFSTIQDISRLSGNISEPIIYSNFKYIFHPCEI